jgi:hypothetical protein
MIEEALREDAGAFMHELVKYMLDPKAIDGAIRSTIHAHGPITFQYSFSTTKRIRGAMKTRLREYMQYRRQHDRDLEASKKV